MENNYSATPATSAINTTPEIHRGNPGDVLKIKTPLGELFIQVGNDPRYPEFFVGLDVGQEWQYTLAHIGYEPDYDEISVNAKDDIGHNMFTKHFCYSSEYIENTTNEILAEQEQMRKEAK